MKIIDDAMRSRLQAWGLSTYNDFADCTRGVVVASTATSQTRRLDLPANPGTATFYLKQYTYTGRGLRHRLNCHKGSIEARNYRLMRDEAGIAVPEVVAIGSQRSRFRLVTAFILTRAIDDARPLDEWWRQQSATGGVPAALQREIAAQLLDVTAKMHRVHFYHVDLQWRNILIRGPAGGVRLFVLDSSRGGRRWLPWMRWHFRMRDLSSLEKSAREFVPRTRRMRFVHEYTRQTACPERPRRLIERIIADRAQKDA